MSCTSQSGLLRFDEHDDYENSRRPLPPHGPRIRLNKMQTKI